MSRRWLAPEFFADEKMKKATVHERLLAAAMIANQDDDGRLRGDPAYLRSIAFLYDDYSLDQVKDMRDHLVQVNPNFILYENSGDDYIQLKRYKRYQKPRYYHPSKLPPPPGWPFPEDSNQAVTKEQPISNHVVTTDLNLNLNKDKNMGEGEGEGEHPSPSPTALPTDKITDKKEIFKTLTQCFRVEWARVPAESLDKIIPREPTARESAQLRDLAKEISAAGGVPPSYIKQAFGEAAGQSKCHISYVRAVLLDWLGVPRSPP